MYNNSKLFPFFTIINIYIKPNYNYHYLHIIITISFYNSSFYLLQQNISFFNGGTYHKKCASWWYYSYLLHLREYLILHCALSLKYSYQYNLEQLKHNFHIFLNYFCFQCKILSMQTAAAAAANTNKHSSKISYLISIARAYLTKIVTAAKIQFNFITDNWHELLMFACHHTIFVWCDDETIYFFVPFPVLQNNHIGLNR